MTGPVRRGRAAAPASRTAAPPTACAEQLYDEAHQGERLPVTEHPHQAAARAALTAALAACDKELLTVRPTPGEPVHPLTAILAGNLPPLSPKAAQRVITQDGGRIAQFAPSGVKMRTLDETLEPVVICDRRTAFIGIADGQGGTLEIRQGRVVQHLVRAFLRDWGRARPYASAPTATDIQRTILKAIVNGQTDETIARRLGLSRRSVAEHVRKISDRLGSSRAQLGYLAAKTHLI
ncbi:LuxR C-terminal-related transcriptional regulator [Streptomyces sp. TS71-3]|uniref:helix-turn-helix transcriptional regulator n=1 Tax=Streptomyces sp. TS71-3 TaxID=2733862 RepID=UPI001B25C5D3|nr:LuxR C-terminal-related transcriptional regulator [Streptomyces sp. TS71-3]GHJ42343.1 hypothetical protein Sm713_79520 [Streptomyces sp. TS71-3]